jgi:hypothetical protein
LPAIERHPLCGFIAADGGRSVGRGNDNSGSGCLIIIALAIFFGGGIQGGVGILAGGWLTYLVFIGVSIGIVMAIIKGIGWK